ncbi:hypothetical protein IB238_09250 [Rhizobium sp. ARZ01]|uniref:hypothetical protein n=1 Tax=Rhizobium sp. ARZ01 TaxID=2769313 RepID=UPI00177F4BB6|nr:hypothetical protein [Rhizobium sp. ARZ01]MBD9372804.1 hypothetical protein [Rhizobium sp. ARZ01]
MSKHTQLPWTATPDGYLAAPSDQMNGGYYVAQVFGPDLIENQKLIEQAVNGYGELLEAAKAVLSAGIINPTGSAKVEAAKVLLEAAIAKASPDITKREAPAEAAE